MLSRRFESRSNTLSQLKTLKMDARNKQFQQGECIGPTKVKLITMHSKDFQAKVVQELVVKWVLPYLIPWAIEHVTLQFKSRACLRWRGQDQKRHRSPKGQINLFGKLPILTFLSVATSKYDKNFVYKVYTPNLLATRDTFLMWREAFLHIECGQRNSVHLYVFWPKIRNHNLMIFLMLCVRMGGWDWLNKIA